MSQIKSVCGERVYTYIPGTGLVLRFPFILIFVHGKVFFSILPKVQKAPN